MQFALIREGKSDDGLVRIIRELLICAGFQDVVGAPRSYPGSVHERISAVLREGEAAGLIFVHRDADAIDPEPRFQEILAAAESLNCVDRVIPVVPIQELEAWLLTDPSAIRSVVGSPNGNAPLNLPKLSKIESTSHPKETLQAACIDASETSGARRKKEVRMFNVRRASLLEQLDIDGDVRHMPSWQKFVEDLNSAAAQLLSRS